MEKHKNTINSSKWPGITIVTPSYNQGQFLEDTIKSVINQKYPNLEYFIIDGGSTDNSVDIIRKYENKIDWWVSEPDDGQSDAIMKGFKQATGVLLNWINSDDLLFPGALKRIAETFMQHSYADLIVGDFALIDADGYITKCSCAPSRFAISVKGFLFPFGQQSAFFSKNALQKVGGLRKNLHAVMDHDLYYRILNNGGKFVRVNGLIGAARVHPAAKGSAKKYLWIEERELLGKEIRINRLIRLRSLYKMRFVRIIDGSYPRSYFSTKIHSGKRITSESLPNSYK